MMKYKQITFVCQFILQFWFQTKGIDYRLKGCILTMIQELRTTAYYKEEE